jgi:hypothetical protein
VEWPRQCVVGRVTQRVCGVFWAPVQTQKLEAPQNKATYLGKAPRHRKKGQPAYLGREGLPLVSPQVRQKNETLRFGEHKDRLQKKSVGRPDRVAPCSALRSVPSSLPSPYVVQTPGPCVAYACRALCPVCGSWLAAKTQQVWKTAFTATAGCLSY